MKRDKSRGRSTQTEDDEAVVQRMWLTLHCKADLNIPILVGRIPGPDPEYLWVLVVSSFCEFSWWFSNVSPPFVLKYWDDDGEIPRASSLANLPTSLAVNVCARMPRPEVFRKALAAGYG